MKKIILMFLFVVCTAAITTNALAKKTSPPNKDGTVYVANHNEAVAVPPDVGLVVNEITPCDQTTDAKQEDANFKDAVITGNTANQDVGQNITNAKNNHANTTYQQNSAVINANESSGTYTQCNSPQQFSDVNTTTGTGDNNTQDLPPPF